MLRGPIIDPRLHEGEDPSVNAWPAVRAGDCSRVPRRVKLLSVFLSYYNCGQLHLGIWGQTPEPRLSEFTGSNVLARHSTEKHGFSSGGTLMHHHHSG